MHSLQRIQNYTLWPFYALTRKAIADKNKGDPNEMMLFHGARIRANKQQGTDEPCISVKCRGRNYYGRSVTIDGTCLLRQAFDKPLPSGAVAWIETYSAVTINP